MTLAWTSPRYLVEGPLIGVRGTFEHRGDLVEHWHIGFEEERYLFVHHLDSHTDELLLLGSSRDEGMLGSLIETLQEEEHDLRL